MFRRKNKQDAARIRTVAEDILKGVAHQGQLDAVWKPDNLIRRDKTLMEQGLALELPAKRTVEVLAFCSWSACRIIISRRARTATGFGTKRSVGTANIMRRKFST